MRPSRHEILRRGAPLKLHTHGPGNEIARISAHTGSRFKTQLIDKGTLSGYLVVLQTGASEAMVSYFTPVARRTTSSR